MESGIASRVVPLELRAGLRLVFAGAVVGGRCLAGYQEIRCLPSKRRLPATLAGTTVAPDRAGSPPPLVLAPIPREHDPQMCSFSLEAVKSRLGAAPDYQ
jgi:hypothetical protein